MIGSTELELELEPESEPLVYSGPPAIEPIRAAPAPQYRTWLPASNGVNVDIKERMPAVHTRLLIL